MKIIRFILMSVVLWPTFVFAGVNPLASAAHDGSYACKSGDLSQDRIIDIDTERDLITISFDDTEISGFYIVLRDSNMTRYSMNGIFEKYNFDVLADGTFRHGVSLCAKRK
jgi:hypothetical protein